MKKPKKPHGFSCGFLGLSSGVPRTKAVNYISCAFSISLVSAAAF